MEDTLVDPFLHLPITRMFRLGEPLREGLGHPRATKGSMKAQVAFREDAVEGVREGDILASPMVPMVEVGTRPLCIATTIRRRRARVATRMSNQLGTTWI